MAQKTTNSNNAYHNVTAHFNSNWYAHEEIKAIEATVTKSLDDDPNQILRLFPKLDTVLAKSFKKESEEAIKMASISIQRHPNSKWVDDSYIQVGLARMYSCDFQNAIQTFKYVNTKGKDPQDRYRALIHLIRTFNEQGEFEKAEEAADFVTKQKLSKANAKNLYLEKAYLYQVQGNYDKMVRNLTLADSLLTRADRKGRIYFLIGQVYQKLGFGAEAYNYYRKCLATTPEYEIDFYARLNMAQVARVDNPAAVKNIRSQFSKMLKDEKNKEFLDKIYFEMGEFEWKQKNLAVALEDYAKAAHAGTSKRVQGMSFLRLAEIHFDTLRKFAKAKAFYDTALTSLPPDYEGYQNIKKRQEILVDFVKYSEAITVNDSLLRMAKMDTALLHKQLDSIQVVQMAREAAQKKKIKQRQEEEESRSSSRNGQFFPTETNTTGDWYFGNPSAVAQGQQEFQRIWGNITLADNWRRSGKSSAGQDDERPVANTETLTNERKPDKGKKEPETLKERPKSSLFKELYAKLPRTEDAEKKAFAAIEEGYFKLGDLYYFKLNEKQNARGSYSTLLDRFPQSEYKPEALYKLYLIAKEIDPTSADRYAKAILSEFPNSTYAKILLNPDYLRETSITGEKQKIIYKEAYADFLQGQLIASSNKIDQAIAMGESGFLPQLDLLKVLITGKTEDITRYQFELGEFAKKHPQSPLNLYANQLLEASKQFQIKLERSKGIRFTRNFEQPHHFVVVHKRKDNLSAPLVLALEKLNTTQFKKANLQATNLALDDDLTMTFVLEFPDLASAKTYFEAVNTLVLNKGEWANYNFDTFVITKENFGTFYRTKALDEYLLFFDRNY